jgi:hypothetical protein
MSVVLGVEDKKQKSYKRFRSEKVEKIIVM